MTAMTNPGERDHRADLLLDVANRIEPAFPEAADELRTLASTPGETDFCDTCIRTRTLTHPRPCMECEGYRAKGEA